MGSEMCIRDRQLTARAPGSAPTGIGSTIGVGVPKGFILEQNYPNPFNPSTTIEYQITTPDIVKLQVFNTLGQLVATLVNERQSTGAYSVNWDAQNLSSGTYFYRLEVGNDFVTRKSVLLR